MQYAFLGKVAVLVDGIASSDAEIFAGGIQLLGLGKVIGMRSWGGAVGCSSTPSSRSWTDRDSRSPPSTTSAEVDDRAAGRRRPDIVVENPRWPPSTDTTSSSTLPSTT